MSGKDKTRANEFDRVAGEVQTKFVNRWGFGSSILDVGCGIGEFTPIFLDRFERVVGLDPEKEYLKEARKGSEKVEYILGRGEDFKLEEKFGTISMNNLLEHVDDPMAVLKNCKRHLDYGGVIIAQVPNSESVTRRLGVFMDIIPSLYYISPEESDFYGHKRTFTLESFKKLVVDSGLNLMHSGGILYKPLPNDNLWDIYKDRDMVWQKRFIEALVKYGEDKPTECGFLYVICG